jgi:hypothetical protein
LTAEVRLLDGLFRMGFNAVEFHVKAESSQAGRKSRVAQTG